VDPFQNGTLNSMVEPYTNDDGNLNHDSLKRKSVVDDMSSGDGNLNHGSLKRKSVVDGAFEKEVSNMNQLENTSSLRVHNALFACKPTLPGAWLKSQNSLDKTHQSTHLLACNSDFKRTSITKVSTSYLQMYMYMFIILIYHFFFNVTGSTSFTRNGGFQYCKKVVSNTFTKSGDRSKL
jgi:hypothetical protein